jgi:hypothetical protein
VDGLVPQRAWTGRALPKNALCVFVRYLIKARVKPKCQKLLLSAIEDGTLGQGSIAGDEYTYNMKEAQVNEEGVAVWVETCFCEPPLAEERPYWEEYFEFLNVKDDIRVGIAATKTAPNRGPAAIAAAPRIWRRNGVGPANHFCKIFVSRCSPESFRGVGHDMFQ